MWKSVSRLTPRLSEIVGHSPIQLACASPRSLSLLSQYKQCSLMNNINHVFTLSRLLSSTSTRFNLLKTDETDVENSGEKTATEIIAELSPQDARSLRIIQMEYDVAFSAGGRVPENVTDDMWLFLLQECPSVNSRRNQLKFWWRKELFKLQREEKKARNLEIEQQRLEEREKAKAEGVVMPIENRMFIRLYDTQMNRFNNSKLAHAMMYGQELVFDMSFDNKMSRAEHQNLVDQLLYVLGQNKKHREPFHMHLCNAHPDSPSMKRWNLHQKRLVSDGNVMITTTQKCYTDMFPKERLVYLSPNAPDYLTKFDKNAVYIVGGFIDKTCKEPLTMAKAKRQGIKMARLPIDVHLKWGSSANKNLTLDQVTNILLDIKATGDWKYSLRHIPVRKLRTAQQKEEDRMRKLARFQKKTIYSDVD